jgi:hypothetical protein
MVSDIEEHKLRVFENRVLRGIFGSKRDEVTGGWRKLHDLYSFQYNQNYQVKEDEVGGACRANGGEEECVQVIGRKAREKDH